jgi:hypothetical protein
MPGQSHEDADGIQRAASACDKLTWRGMSSRAARKKLDAFVALRTKANVELTRATSVALVQPLDISDLISGRLSQ